MAYVDHGVAASLWLMSSAPVHIIAMGVSATGKTVVGEAMAKRLNYRFIEGDDYHPKANIEKMAAGTALTDEDRKPWLEALSDLISQCDAAGTSTVLTCSALRRSYRDLLRSAVPHGELFFVHLHAPYEVLEERMAERTKHFMPATLLTSQFETLEPLGADETGVLVDVSPPADVVVDDAVRAVCSHYAS